MPGKHELCFTLLADKAGKLAGLLLAAVPKMFGLLFW
jgi:hypothetical protein